MDVVRPEDADQLVVECVSDDGYCTAYRLLRDPAEQRRRLRINPEQEDQRYALYVLAKAMGLPPEAADDVRHPAWPGRVRLRWEGPPDWLDPAGF